VTTRAEDHGKLYAWWGRYGRDLTTVIAVGLAAWAVIGVVGEAREVKKTQAEQKKGRAIAIAVTCAATSATIDAGRATITGQIGAPLPSRFARALERLGYPPQEVRDEQAREVARAYGDLIARRVQAAAQTAGVERELAEDLVTESGRLDCRRIGRASRVNVGDADGK
jgi:hypothetical protein